MISLLNISFSCILCYLGGISLLGLIIFMVILYLTTSDKIPEVMVYPSETFYVNPKTGENEKFPFNVPSASVFLSVVVPAYNEEERLPIMMEETLEYLQKRQKTNTEFTYEIIIVDDGSKDKTTQIGLEYVKKYGSELIRVLTLHKNRGKGGAVRLGVLSSRGENILFVDADGATQFSDLDHVEAGLRELSGGKQGMAVSVGSRAHLQDNAVAQRSVLRNILMYGFHFLVYVTCVEGVRDTQCGFKLFTRDAALTLFTALHVERWAFDVELLYLAQSMGIPIAEKAVNWQEIDGSKMVPIFSWLQMGKDLILIRARYVIGAWAIHYGPLNLV